MYVVHELDCFSRYIVLVTQPYQNLSAICVYRAHTGYLIVFLRNIVLENTDGVNPEFPRPGYVVAQGKKRRMQVGGNDKILVVELDLLLMRLVSPHIGQSLVRRPFRTPTIRQKTTLDGGIAFPRQ
jgi:hypothetical protein